jgi:hypothetical protein
MNKTSSLIRRLITWLNERETPCASIPSLREWADLPAHHPNN